MSVELDTFAKRFLTSRVNWYNIPRNAITHFGDMISFVLYRQGQYQVELFISPSFPSSFKEHRHPNVDTYEFPLAGHNMLCMNGTAVYSEEQVEAWLADSTIKSQLVPIPHDAWHSGGGNTYYAFLSIQEWLNGVEPSSVGLDWLERPLPQLVDEEFKHGVAVMAGKWL